MSGFMKSKSIRFFDLIENKMVRCKKADKELNMEYCPVRWRIGSRKIRHLLIGRLLSEGHRQQKIVKLARNDTKAIFRRYENLQSGYF